MDSLPFTPIPPPDPNFRIPKGAVEGWRAWKVRGDKPEYGLPPRLFSATNTNYFWVPRRESVAECDKRVPCEPDELPGERCRCGFYSAKTLKHLLAMPYPKYDGTSGWYTVIGRVANWGLIREGSLGWRVQKSYPVELFVPYEAAIRIGHELSRTYGVPVRPLNWLKPYEQVKGVNS